MLTNTFLIIFLCCLGLFLFQIAVQFIKLERKLTQTVEVLEEELIDVFGTSLSLEEKVAIEEAKVKKEDKKPSTPPPAAKAASAAKPADSGKKAPAKPRK